MKKIIVLTASLFSVTTFAYTNLTDAIDANEVPAKQEQRENELINQPDIIDKNNIPSAMEERKRKEEWRRNYKKIQDDMPRMNKEKE